MTAMSRYTIKVVMFDFGGVIADEGFRNGLIQIANMNNLDGEEFFHTAREVIHDTGYLTGKGTEGQFWKSLRDLTGIRGSDAELKDIILKGFTVRGWMLELISWLKGKGIRLAILSDQTNWLNELEKHMNIFNLFEVVFNSYHLGKSKRDKTIFSDAAGAMHIKPGEALFVDDAEGHVERAREMGLHAIFFTEKGDFLKGLSVFFPDLPGDL